uniref:EGF-like domain-containing protein n=1 Tax=Rhabditophanes sp. KR3021 TaxID=114890 RepID=A0AC35U9Z4_9BILA
MKFIYLFFYLFNLLIFAHGLAQGDHCKAGGAACDSGLICNPNAPSTNPGHFKCTLECTQDFQCLNNGVAKECKSGLDIVTGANIKGCVSPISERCLVTDICGQPDRKCGLFSARCDFHIFNRASCSTTSEFCLPPAGCNPTPAKADGTFICTVQCTKDDDCRLRTPGACKLLPDVKSLIPVKFCTTIDPTRVVNCGSDCPAPNLGTNVYTGECIRSAPDIKQSCSKSTDQCKPTLGCNPYIQNVCARICTTDADCFDSTSSFKCVTGIDAVDNLGLMFCKVGKSAECSLDSECTSKGPLFVCNLFSLQCSMPIGPFIGKGCGAGGLPCYESVCNSNVNNICTLPCTVDANCGSAINPGTCETSTDNTINGGKIKICKLSKNSPSCDTSGSCTEPLVCSQYTYTCEQPPLLGEPCIKDGISCQDPFVCNSLTVSGTDSYCTLPCIVDGNCVKDNVVGKCTEITDVTANGGTVNVCIYDDTTPSCTDESDCTGSDVCNLFTLKCEISPNIGEVCIIGGIPCLAPSVCNPFGEDGLICTETCNNNCPEGYSCIATIDPTSSGSEIRVCSNGDECNQSNLCGTSGVCYVTTSGNRCAESCLFTSDCESGESCKRVTDPINIGNVLFVCTPLGYPQCDALNLCTYPQGCNTNTFTCERQSGFGEVCYNKGVACKDGYVCNPFTKINSMYTCTRPCSSHSDCGYGGRCILLPDPTTGINIEVCFATGNTCILGICPQYQLCNTGNEPEVTENMFQFIKSIGIRMRKYWKAFSGNAVNKLMKRMDEYLKVLPNSSIGLINMKVILNKLSNIYCMIFAAGVDDVAELKHALKELIDAYKIGLISKNMTITPKTCTLIYHALEQLERHRSLMLFSEQEQEANDNVDAYPPW